MSDVLHCEAIPARRQPANVRHDGLPFGNTWTKDQFDLAVSLWAGGFSCGSIAHQINERFGTVYTRNAVCGKTDRHKAMFPARPSRVKVQRPRRDPSEKRARFAGDRTPGVAVAVAEGAAPADFLAVLFEDIADSQCRYPGGSDPITFCGQPRMETSAYCPDCYRRCYWTARRAA